MSASASTNQPDTKLSPAQNEQLQQIIDDIDAYLANDDFDQAIEHLASKIAQASADELLQGALYAQRAELYLEQEDNQTALNDIRLALKAGWDSVNALSTAAWAYYALDKFENARDYFELALKAEPNDISLLTGYALALQELEEFERARMQLTYAIDLDPQDAMLFSARGDIYLKLGEFGAAERDIRQAMALEPYDLDHPLALARILLVKGNLDDALSAVDNAIDENEPSLEALLLRSHLHLMAGRAQDARHDAMRASNQFPHEAFAFVQLAHVQLAEGNVALSSKAAERAVKLDPSLPDSYLVRGAARQLKGEMDEARKDLQRAQKAPAELPMFLLGAAYDSMANTGFDASIMEMFENFMNNSATQEAINENFQAGQKAAGQTAAGMGAGLGGFDPMQMLGQIFDESGNIKGPFKGIFDMALKNAPNMMKNMPPEILANMGGIDPSQLDDIDMSEVSSEKIEEQMREFYKKMQSGDNPFAGFPNPFSPKEPEDK